MKVINVHKRIIQQPASKVGVLLNTLATANDKILAINKWPAMKLDKALTVGSKGGHGLIKYIITAYHPQQSITFQFDMPGFNGYHQFDIIEINNHQTQLSHIIDMHTTGLATLKWTLAIRWLHDAYIEDAFDKVENHFTLQQKRTEWSRWVKLLRRFFRSYK